MSLLLLSLLLLSLRTLLLLSPCIMFSELRKISLTNKTMGYSCGFAWSGEVVWFFWGCMIFVWWDCIFLCGEVALVFVKRGCVTFLWRLLSILSLLSTNVMISGQRFSILAMFFSGQVAWFHLLRGCMNLCVERWCDFCHSGCMIYFSGGYVIIFGNRLRDFFCEKVFFCEKKFSCENIFWWKKFFWSLPSLLSLLSLQ